VLSHRERLLACITDDPALDRPPVALWRHFPVDDQTPETLAAATLAYQRQFDFDLVKVTPASSFCLKDWGVDDKWEGDTEGTRRYTKRIIRDPSDWEKLPILNPDSPWLANQLKCLKLIRADLDPETPLLQTIFNPLAQAKNLAGGETLIVHLRKFPESVMKGLEIIAESTKRFIAAAADTGIDGIFYAIQHAQSQLLTEEEFSRYSLLFDVTLLNSSRDLQFNMVHLHGNHVMFDQVADLPMKILNWHDRETAWSLADGQKRFRGVVCGGLKRETVVLGAQAEVMAEIDDAWRQTSDKRFVLGTGCVVPITAPYGNIMTVRQSMEKHI
jgi:uroporphyrinogen decarboxylase